MAKVKSPSSTLTRKTRPALSPEARETQMISLAMDLVEQRLRDGTASSQETTYFLKAASPKYRQEIAKLEEENKLLRAKTEAIHSQKRSEELYEEAIAAMKRYSGYGSSEEEDEFYDD